MYNCLKLFLFSSYFTSYFVNKVHVLVYVLTRAEDDYFFIGDEDSAEESLATRSIEFRVLALLCYARYDNPRYIW